MHAEPGDLLLFVADEWEAALKVLGQLRLFLAQRLNIIPEGKDSFLWVVDFPLLEYDQAEGRYTSNHHPFTAPLEEDLPLLTTDPLKVRSQAYDLVYNGIEVAGGSQRIYRKDLQEKIFNLLGMAGEEVEEKFGFFVQAFQYGMPPHGGIAFGLDRLIMLMAKEDSIRDVIAFPKVKDASCLMTEAPGTVDDKQLDELGIAIEEAENK